MTTPCPVPIALRCPAGCGLGDALRCWLRHRRELIADLAAATTSGNHPDAETLRADLRAAERHLNRLVRLGRRWQGEAA